MRFFLTYKWVFLYAATLVVLLLLLNTLQYEFLFLHYSYEVYVLCIAVLFAVLGGWLALKLVKPKTIVVETKRLVSELTPTDLQQLERERQQLNLSSRELEVLQLMARGLSNQEIADQLFLSLPTVKTHSSRLFEKLDVKRRTQAVEKGRQLRLID